MNSQILSMTYQPLIPPEHGPASAIDGSFLDPTQTGTFHITFRVTIAGKSKDFETTVFRPLNTVPAHGYVTAEVRNEIVREAWAQIQPLAADWAEYVANVCPVGCSVDCETGGLIG